MLILENKSSGCLVLIPEKKISQNLNFFNSKKPQGGHVTPQIFFIKKSWIY
jgi:hypothetical protein